MLLYLGSFSFFFTLWKCIAWNTVVTMDFQYKRPLARMTPKSIWRKRVERLFLPHSHGQKSMDEHQQVKPRVTRAVSTKAADKMSRITMSTWVSFAREEELIDQE